MAKYEITNEGKSESEKKKIVFGLVVAGGLCGIGTFLMMRYKTSSSNEWLVRTGLMVKDMEIGKKFIQLPFQNVERINMNPQSIKFSVNAMSKEKMEFNFPAIFTIGPKNDEESLIKYSRFLLNQHPDETTNLIRGVIEGETRSLAANQSIEDIFKARTVFKNDIVNIVQKQLDHYGLEIYNANVEELKDSKSSNYFYYLSQKINAEAENNAKVQVAEQKKIGDVGAKEREGDTRQQISIIESRATLTENMRQQEILKSKAELEKLRAEQELIVQQALIRAKQEALSLQIDLEKDVEIKRLEMKTEQQKAEELSKARVQAEISIKDAEGYASSQKIKADALLYAKQKEAEAMLYTKQKEAEGSYAVYKAQADGLEQIVKTFNGDYHTLLSYTMLDKGVYEKLAHANAEAIKGLNPKITVWSSDADKSMDVIKHLGKGMIPMIDTIHEQTGYKLPEWIIKKDEQLK